MKSLPHIFFLFYASLMVAQDAMQQPAGLSFDRIEVPGALITVVAGINTAGTMSGYYSNTGFGDGVGFRLKDGAFNYFTYGNSSTEALGINDSEVITGYAFVGSVDVVGFTYDGKSFEQVRAPGENTVFCSGINNDRIVVGSAGNLGNPISFEYRNGKFRNITPPPRDWTMAPATGINQVGHVVGYTTGGGELGTTGFYYNGGKFTDIAVPGSIYTLPQGINDSDVVVGWYTDCTPSCRDRGFALKKGKYISFDYPGAVDTYPVGINSAGQIVGGYDYHTLDGASYGFVSSPITPADFERPGCCLYKETH